eukprot:TRINITY_DN9459_c0_g3_i2.p2 TRINITY_DN9459_c0_g3~~TRINITY_DN9459_c0_g3_i2.p2  ORF type:complete len:115 (-),score=30.36 TRINITY_DN9459_c0_g3_i2:54-398(-)
MKEKLNKLSKENKDLQEVQKHLEHQQVHIKGNKDKLRILGKKLEALKSAFNNTNEVVGKEYYHLKEKVGYQEKELEKASSTVTMLLNVLKQKDKEIIRLQSEANYFRLKLSNIF